MSAKRKGYGFIRVGVGRKTSARDKRRVAATQSRRRQERPQDDPWWMRSRRPGDHA
jgi:hypothetical protein